VPTPPELTIGIEERTSADGQLATFHPTGDPKAVVDELISETEQGVREPQSVR
jgi:hypothetical protein